jgi:hypothetical protein
MMKMATSSGRVAHLCLWGGGKRKDKTPREEEGSEIEGFVFFSSSFHGRNVDKLHEKT